MDEKKVITQTGAENTIVNNLLEMCQQNDLAIQNLVKDAVIFKNNTSRNNDTYANE